MRRLTFADGMPGSKIWREIMVPGTPQLELQHPMSETNVPCWNLRADGACANSGHACANRRAPQHLSLITRGESMAEGSAIDGQRLGRRRTHD